VHDLLTRGRHGCFRASHAGDSGRLATHRVIALAEPGQTIHQPFADAAMRWLSGTAVREGFAVYFQFGHKAELFDSPTFTRLFLNAMRWSSNH